MNKKLIAILAMALGCGNAGAMQKPHKPTDTQFNRLIAKGNKQEILVHKVDETELKPWGFTPVVSSGFAESGDRFKLVTKTLWSYGIIVYDYNGNQIFVCDSEPLSKPYVNLIPHGVDNTSSVYNAYMSLQWHELQQHTEPFLDRALAYSCDKKKNDAFVFYEPGYGLDETILPTYLHGLVYVIMAHFPCELPSTASDDVVLEAVEKSKHVCAFKIENNTLKLVRNFGTYPYCRGLYVNPVRPMLAVLYGNGIETEKCLKFIKLEEPILCISTKTQASFCDVVVKCQN